MKKYLLASAVTIGLLSPLTHAADYIIDHKGAHASVNFKIKHLGYSWLHGRFNTFDGEFNYDAEKPNASQIMVNIDTTSLDSNHAERDKHLRGKDFLNVDKYPTATFKSTNITLDKIGEGQDPWGGYRVGFEGETSLKLSDYGINYNLGPASTHVDIGLFIEGIRK